MIIITLATFTPSAAWSVEKNASAKPSAKAKSKTAEAPAGDVAPPRFVVQLVRDSKTPIEGLTFDRGPFEPVKSRFKKDVRPRVLIKGKFSKKGWELSWSEAGKRKTRRLKNSFSYNFPVGKVINKIEFSAISNTGRISRETIVLRFDNITDFAAKNNIKLPENPENDPERNRKNNQRGIGTFKVDIGWNFSAAIASFFNDSSVTLASSYHLDFGLMYSRELFTQKFRVLGGFAASILDRQQPPVQTLQNEATFLMRPQLGASFEPLEKFYVLGLLGFLSRDIITSVNSNDVIVQTAFLMDAELGVRWEDIVKFGKFGITGDVRLILALPLLSQNGFVLKSGFGQDFRVEGSYDLGAIHRLGLQIFLKNNETVTNFSSQTNGSFGTTLYYRLNLD